MNNDFALHVGDCLETLRATEDGSFDLTVTSPPYDNLRTYNGYSFDFENIAKELYRTTKEGGVVVWVVGDATIKGSESGTSFRQALYFKDECGFNLHDTMIYSRYPMPNSSKRYEQYFEFMFVLSKGQPKTFNPLMEPCIYAGVGTSPTSRGKDGVLRGKGRRVINDTKKRGNIWHYSAGKGKSSEDEIAYQHPAIFPEALARDHILSWSNPGDVVFDPFTGSGTTGKIALETGRRFVGCEISEEYMEIAKKRLGQVPKTVVEQSPEECKHCSGFFDKYRCNTPLECDCPKCQGYCECGVEQLTLFTSPENLSKERHEMSK